MKAKHNDRQPAAPLRLIDKARVAERIGGTGSHVEYLERTDHTFPRGFRLGPAFNSAKRWLESEIDDWLLARIASRDADAVKLSKVGAALAQAKVRRAKQSEKVTG